jgi:hypothetical protein
MNYEYSIITWHREEIDAAKVAADEAKKIFRLECRWNASWKAK